MASIFQRWRTISKPSVINVTLSGDASTQVLNMSARELYQTQDNLQAVVNFLANSIAQLPLKVYRRDGEAERRRDRDSVAALLLWRPNDYQTSFEFIRGLAEEYFVYGCVYVWVVPDVKADSGYMMHLEARFPYHGSGAMTRSPSPLAWRPDFPGAPREAH